MFKAMVPEEPSLTAARSTVLSVMLDNQLKLKVVLRVVAL